MSEWMDLMKLTGICPIMADIAAESVVPAAEALVEGGLPVVEVLMRNSNSPDNLERIARELPGVIVGAGSVLNVRMAEEVIDRGAKFVVMPGFGRAVVEFCQKKNIPVLPGCVTATEIMMALEYGIEVVKFFPIYQMGGAEILLQFRNGPFSNVKFVVTGGLNSKNFLPLMECPNTLAAGGDWMFADENALGKRNFKQITCNLRRSINNVQELRTARATR